MVQIDLQALHRAGIIDSAKLREIEAYLSAQPSNPGQATQASQFDVPHVLWYAGALIIIGAMGLFTTDAFNRMGGWALTTCGAVYAVVLTVLGDRLWRRNQLHIPGGLLIAAAISMVPMMIYGVQDALDLWRYAQGDPGQYKNVFPNIHGSWLYMETGTVLAALAAVMRYRFPFILLIAAVALWFMSMDVAMWFTASSNDYWDFDTRRWISLLFGLVMIACAWAYDVIRGRTPDMMFWIHLFGGLAFWGGLSLSDSGSQLGNFAYLLINVAAIGFSLFVDRRIYAVLGALGVAGYLGYLAKDVFQDVIGFSFALSGLGLAVIFAGMWLHKNRQRVSEAIDRVLPPGLRDLRHADLH